MWPYFFFRPGRCDACLRSDAATLLIAFDARGFLRIFDARLATFLLVTPLPRLLVMKHLA